MTSSLIRPRRRVIGGVCAALADRLGLSANVVRLLFVLSCVLPGPQFLVYLVLWVTIPSE
jgi:phage shock protein PspC (stress-responsive transcriptional regulator)